MTRAPSWAAPVAIVVATLGAIALAVAGIGGAIAWAWARVSTNNASEAGKSERASGWASVVSELGTAVIGTVRGAAA